MPYVVTTKRRLSCTCWGAVGEDESGMCRACLAGGELVSRRAIATPPHDHAERVLWSTLADDVGVELRWDPPTQDGDYLHAAQREELEAVLAAWNAKHGQT